MTAQISDTFIFRDNPSDLLFRRKFYYAMISFFQRNPSDLFYRKYHYQEIGMEGGHLFNPHEHGLEPTMSSTACYRGFYCTYVITKAGIHLRNLTIHQESGKQYPPINNVTPSVKDGEGVYNGLKLPIPFTGKLRLAKGFIEKYYVHMGYQDATAFKTVLDLTFDNGKLVRINDRSKECAKNRGAFKKWYESHSGTDTITKAFSLSMNDPQEVDGDPIVKQFDAVFIKLKRQKIDRATAKKMLKCNQYIAEAMILAFEETGNWKNGLSNEYQLRVNPTHKDF